MQYPFFPKEKTNRTEALLAYFIIAIALLCDITGLIKDLIVSAFRHRKI